MRSKELKEVDKEIKKMKLNDFETLATYVVFIYNWLCKMERASPFAKYVKNKFIEVIPDGLIDFDKNKELGK